ncbi:hypothetical protein CLOM_g8978 [Closterium sp. NIES-68]|nr:hypothetical protein CLOM_g8978 [Closterium sp. NIES-68]GJP58783.1 hypothetical protein CLOP_g3524 [Closterium sp. NIES-67]
MESFGIDLGPPSFSGNEAPKSDGQSPERDVAPILSSEPHFERSRSMAAGHHGFKGATVMSGVFNLSTSVIGAGIMGLPATMKVLGLPFGVILLVAMGILTEISIELLIRTTTVQHVWSYSDLVHQVHGNKWRLALDISIVINNFGICIVYLIICADVLSGTTAGGQYHEGMFMTWNGGQSAWWTGRHFILFLIIIVFLLPLLSFRHVDNLQYTSFLAVLLAVVFVIITIVIAAININNGTLPVPSFLPDFSSAKSIMAMLGVIPIMATAYVCHFNVHPIYVELQERNEKTMLKISRYTISLCTIVYLLTSISGYLLFGASTANDVLVNFDRDLGIENSQAVNDIVRMTYIIHLIFVFPVIFYSLRNITDDLLFPGAVTPLVDDTKRFWLSTAVELVLIYLGSTVIPNMTLAFDITGATTTMIVGMLIPAMLALSDKSGVIVEWERKLAWFMIGFAILVSITGLASSIYYIVVHF